MLCVVHLKHLSCWALAVVKTVYKDLVRALYVYTTISMRVRQLAEQFVQLSLDLTKTLPRVSICEIRMKNKIIESFKLTSFILLGVC
jgi:hypothetical protein